MPFQLALENQVKWFTPCTLTLISWRGTPFSPHMSSSMALSSFWVPNTSWQQPKALISGTTSYSVATHSVMGLV